jgi:hypothetical protein
VKHPRRIAASLLVVGVVGSGLLLIEPMARDWDRATGNVRPNAIWAMAAETGRTYAAIEADISRCVAERKSGSRSWIIEYAASAECDARTIPARYTDWELLKLRVQHVMAYLAAWIAFSFVPPAGFYLLFFGLFPLAKRWWDWITV